MESSTTSHDIGTSKDISSAFDIGLLKSPLEDDLVQEALRKGTDLRQYSKQIEKELQDVENASIADYIKEAGNIAQLHTQICSVDGILGRMESMLHGFQEDLGNISYQIQTLQEQSVNMNLKLKNRQAVKGELSQFVDEMVISDTLVEAILDSPVTDRAFLENLHELDHKINFAKEQSFKEAKSCGDIKDVLEKLKLKAAAKIREFLLAKINAFKKPMANYQMPQNAMLKTRFFFEFLLAHQRDVAKEIQDEYVDVLSKIYFSYFKTYLSRLSKLQYDEAPDRDDLLGVDETQKRSLFAKPTMKTRSAVFTLGSRGGLLAEVEAPILVPHAAADNKMRYPYESLFRSHQYAIVDNCCREYLFVCDFFMLVQGSSQALDVFTAIFDKTLGIFFKHVEAFTQETFDAFALLLCLHLCFRFRSLMQTRGVTALNKYWDAVEKFLWKRFKFVLDLHVESVRTTDPSKLGAIETRPHYITRRYAELAGSVMSVNGTWPSETVSRCLAQLQVEVENFVLRMAAEFPTRPDQLIFLINNYDMIISVIVEKTATEESAEVEGFKELLASRTTELVEEILFQFFGGLMVFVKEAEAALERGSVETLASRKDERHVTQLAHSFANDWKRAIDAINAQVMRSFSNFKQGQAIVQTSLAQMIQYYHRFIKLFNVMPFKNYAVKGELLNIHHIMVEVKKHKSTF